MPLPYLDMVFFPSSIRFRLPFNYAGIALLATLALGAVLLLTLQQFYRQQELDYLTGNARTISEEVSSLLEAEVPAEVLQAQLQGFAFLSQTRVRLLNPERALLADSGAGSETERFITLAVDINSEITAAGVNFSRETAESSGANQVQSRIVVSEGLFSQNVEETVSISPDGQEVVSELTTSGTPYGFGLNQELTSSGRSNQSVRYPVISPLGDLLGYIELSEGPAYGRDVLTSVAVAWAISSIVAMAIAAVVGWFASRRLTRPLLSLTATTTAMSAGNLAARTAIKRGDELGTLAHAFNGMADQLEETILTLRRFVADAAHELNTPLTALRTNLELAAGAQPHPHLEQAQAQLRRLEQLTAGLLNLSSLEAQVNSDKPLVINLNNLVQESGELFASQAEQKEVDFILHLPEEAITVSGHPAVLWEAWENLLENALKFTEPHGRVTVSLTAEGRWAHLEICDSGIGIPAEDVPRLFGRFFRGHNTASYPGNGLGLAIAQTIVRQHGGEIEVRPLPVGTCFTVKLPLIA